MSLVDIHLIDHTLFTSTCICLYVSNVPSQSLSHANYHVYFVCHTHFVSQHLVDDLDGINDIINDLNCQN